MLIHVGRHPGGVRRSVQGSVVADVNVGELPLGAHALALPGAGVGVDGGAARGRTLPADGPRRPLTAAACPARPAAVDAHRR